MLDRLGVGYAVLHGGLPGKDRKAVLEQFQTDPACRVFLSTDAGGTGLNLQTADTVVNLELPWNPAVLEQRIARVHRMGQSRPVRVVNFVTRGTIEEKVLRTLEAKQGLFAGVFDGRRGRDPVRVGQPAEVPRRRPRPARGAEARANAAVFAADPGPRLALWQAGAQMIEALNQLAATEPPAWARRRPRAAHQVAYRTGRTPPPTLCHRRRSFERLTDRYGERFPSHLLPALPARSLRPHSRSDRECTPVAPNSLGIRRTLHEDLENDGRRRGGRGRVLSSRADAQVSVGIPGVGSVTVGNGSAYYSPNSYGYGQVYGQNSYGYGQSYSMRRATAAHLCAVRVRHRLLQLPDQRNYYSGANYAYPTTYGTGTRTR